MLWSVFVAVVAVRTIVVCVLVPVTLCLSSSRYCLMWWFESLSEVSLSVGVEWFLGGPFDQGGNSLKPSSESKLLGGDGLGF